MRLVCLFEQVKYLSLTLETWREKAAEQRRLMRIATRVVVRILERRLAAAMGTWIEHFDKVQRIRNLMLQSVARMTDIVLWSAFSTWKNGVEICGEV
jgi:hypothetical protein